MQTLSLASRKIIELNMQRGIDIDSIFKEAIRNLYIQNKNKQYTIGFKKFCKNNEKELQANEAILMELWAAYWNDISLEMFNKGVVDKFPKIKPLNGKFVRVKEVTGLGKEMAKRKEKDINKPKNVAEIATESGSECKITKFISDAEFDMLTEGQKEALRTLRTGNNVFLTGEAGTGKSFVLEKYIKECEMSGLNTLITAPTGVAAINIGGVTLHRTFKIPVRMDELFKKANDFIPIPQTVKCAQVIIIDEISMARYDIFSYVADIVLRLDAQLIVVGDFFQLPPVTTREDGRILSAMFGEHFKDGFAFETSEWNDFDFHVCYLKEIKRQNSNSEAGKKFIENLNKARIGDKRCIDYFNDYSNPVQNSGIYVCGKNSDVAQKNNEMLSKLTTKEYIYMSDIVGKVNPSDKPVDDEIRLKVGARVMTVINDPKGRYQNGSFGTVVNLAHDQVTIEFDSGVTVSMKRNKWEVNDYEVVDNEIVKSGVKITERSVKTKVIGTFTQFPLKLAYAITIHKSQGQTFETMNLNPYAFDAGQLYVALSRIRDISGLHLTSPIRERYLITSSSAVDFYKSIDCMFNTEAIVRHLCMVSDEEINNCPEQIKKYLIALKEAN